MTSSALPRGGRVKLLDAEPDLGEYLPPEERALAEQVVVTVHEVSPGELEPDGVLAERGAFAAVILDGMVMHRMAMGDKPALRLLGPRDILTRAGQARSSLLVHTGHRAVSHLRLAILDDRVLLVARRFPRLFAGLQTRVGEQHQRLAAQMVICQLPRVEDRVLAIMWLLAESWGRVTANGTVLPLALTHDIIGELIGARRPTVTLALKELAESGALFRQDGGWVLLEPPMAGVVPEPLRRWPELITDRRTGWVEEPPSPTEANYPLPLFDVVATLRQDYRRHEGEVRSAVDRARPLRERNLELRERIATERRARRTAP